MYSPVSLRPLPSSYRPSVVDLPSTQPQDNDDDDDDDDDKEEEEEEEDAAESDENDKDDGQGLQPLADGLVTLSLLPKSRWCNLHNLDIIKVWVETSSAWPHPQYNSVSYHLFVSTC